MSLRHLRSGLSFEHTVYTVYIYWVEQKVFAFFKWKVNLFFNIFTIFNQLYNFHCLLLPSPNVLQAFQFRPCKNFLVLIQNMLGYHRWPIRIFQISCYLNGFAMIWINDNPMVPSLVNMAGGPKFPNLVPLFSATSFCWHGDGRCPGERQLLFCWRDVDVFL
jgi:hypothetical protein